MQRGKVGQHAGHRHAEESGGHNSCVHLASQSCIQMLLQVGPELLHHRSRQLMLCAEPLSHILHSTLFQTVCSTRCF